MKQWAFLPAVLFVGTLSAAHFDCALVPPPKEQQDRLVWQFTEFLSHSEEQQLNAKLVQFARGTSNRLLVIVVDTLCGLPESDLAFDIGEKWGIGKAGFDNGIVFLIKPNGTPGERKVFIATGYGLEGAIPDLRARQVIEGTVIPNFKQGNYAGGVDRATDMLMAMAKGEFNEKSYGKRRFPWPALIVLALFLGTIVFAWRGRVRRYAATNNVDFWTAMWLLNQMDQRHRGRWTSGFPGGGFGGRGGGGFGGGGGGFGGFGGGSFGGGGAGGSW
ncbi:MAG: TPM domain-containing protein [Flavobacteriales bacterium]|nr:TPM domain-containing protein [Flavobacteriales bacterium]